MSATHWTPGDQRRPTPIGSRYRAVCGRWVGLKCTDIPARVTCKQCRRYLQRLIDDER